MRVAIVINTSWNIYNFRMGLIKKLKQEGHEVIAIAPHDEFSEKLKEEGCTYVPVTMDSRGVNPLKDTGLIYELYRIYKRVSPDVILHYTIKPNIYGTLAASLLRIPVVNNVCGLGTAFLQKNFVSRLATLMYRISFWYPKKIFFQNDDDLELFVNNRIVSKNSSDVLPGSGVDLSKFKPTRDVEQRPFTFLMVSRLILDKGVLEYLEAAKALKDKGINTKIQLLGAKDPNHRRGISNKLIDKLIAESGVEYLGTSDNVAPIISQADCVVLPSYREGTPRTLLEAASCAKPIVATDVPGCNNVVEDGVNGYLCKERNAGDLAQKMLDMLKLSNDQLVEMGLKSREIAVKRFDEALVIDKYVEIIRKVRKSA